MKLYIKQKVFSWGDKFVVKDEYGNDRYFVQGEVFSWGKKLHVYNINDAEIAYIEQKLISFMPRYKIFIHGSPAVEMVQKFAFFQRKYFVEELGWSVYGDFWAHEYEISRNGMQVALICKEWFTWGDSYVLDVNDPNDELAALAVILSVDCMTAQESN